MRHDAPTQRLLRRRPAGREFVRQFHRRVGCRDRKDGGTPARTPRSLGYDCVTGSALDITVKGEKIPALITAPKRAHVYPESRNRQAGSASKGAVPISNVPGQGCSQPFPVKPPCWRATATRPGHRRLPPIPTSGASFAPTCRRRRAVRRRAVPPYSIGKRRGGAPVQRFSFPAPVAV